MSQTLTLPQRLSELRTRHARWIPVGFFALGFCFDAYMLRRIDEPAVLVQQGLYLAVAAWLIYLNLTAYRPKSPAGAKLWHYHEELLHFLLGTLLNGYTIFFFKSASLFTSAVFVAFLCGVLYLNESKRFKSALFALCLTCYTLVLVPIIWGELGILPFALGLLGAQLVALPFACALYRRQLLSQLTTPMAAIQAVFLALYLFHLIPPVPLSIQYLGVYHNVERGKGEYQLTMTRSWWRFWEHGDQTFLARPGDKVYCFARIFAPTRFHDELRIRWLYHDPRQGWHAWDSIPMPVHGGREEGYRAFAVKANYTPGDWRVQIETSDGRELGRLYFSVENDTETSNRELRTVAQ